MNWLHDALAEFGRLLGLPALRLGDGGVAQLDLQAGGVLAIEPSPAGDEVLVYLGRPLGFEGGAVLRSALEKAHHDAALPVAVQVAVRGHGPEALLLVMARVPAADFSVAALGRVTDYLGRWSDEVRHG
jgi:type III secretion system chaperone SycN